MTESAILPRMHPDEKKRLRLAAFYARNLDLGPLGELAYRELEAAAEFDYRLGRGALTVRLADQLHELWAQREGRVA